MLVAVQTRCVPNDGPDHAHWRHSAHIESRERILDATIEITSRRGYHGTSTAAVSKRSGLPASSIYWRFKNKDDLIAAVIQRTSIVGCAPPYKEHPTEPSARALFLAVAADRLGGNK